MDDVLDTQPEFIGIVRFTDLSTRRYDNYESLIDNSANDREPESLTLKWSVFSLTNDGSPVSGNIEIVFMTEKMLDNQESGPGEFAHASVQLTVAGSGEEWVSGSFARLEPFIRATNVSVLFRWMNVFRNKWFIELLKYVSALTGFMVGMYYSSSYVNGLREIERSQIYREIISGDDLNAKFDRFVRYVIDPSDPGLLYSMLPLFVGLLSYVVLYIIAMKFVPLMAPSSSVDIGLTGKFRRDTRNVLRFIIVDILILAIIIPIALAWII